MILDKGRTRRTRKTSDKHKRVNVCSGSVDQSERSAKLKSAGDFLNEHSGIFVWRCILCKSRNHWPGKTGVIAKQSKICKTYRGRKKSEHQKAWKNWNQLLPDRWNESKFKKEYSFSLTGNKRFAVKMFFGEMRISKRTKWCKESTEPGWCSNTQSRQNDKTGNGFLTKEP